MYVQDTLNRMNEEATLKFLRELIDDDGSPVKCEYCDEDAVEGLAIYNPADALRELTNGTMVDRVIECGGNEVTMKMAVELCARRGKVVMTGLLNEPIGINYFPIVWDEIDIIGSFSHVYDLDYRIATELIGRGMVNVESLITGRISMDNVIPEGIEEFMKNSRHHIKILASPHLM